MSRSYLVVIFNLKLNEIVPLLKMWATALLRRRTGFSPRPIIVGFLVHKMILEHVFSMYFSPMSLMLKSPLLFIYVPTIFFQLLRCYFLTVAGIVKWHLKKNKERHFSIPCAPFHLHDLLFAVLIPKFLLLMKVACHVFLSPDAPVYCLLLPKLCNAFILFSFVI
jgi:hypothetical protein